MDWAQQHPLLATSSALLTLAFLWLWKLNAALKATPPEVLATSPHRWTDDEIKQTYEKIKETPIDWAKHLPPKLNRRYIITGGSGGVGGEIILQLLKRGQSPESIRNVDFRPPARADMLAGSVTRVDFAQTDISSASSTNAAFSRPWPASVANLPLTVFHTAAVIIFNERSLATYARTKAVNVDGAQNVLNAARAASADVFVATGSAAVATRPVEYWGSSFRRWPRHYWQAIDESDFDRPVRPHAQFFGNYAYSKAVSERLVCEANSLGFRTGVIRPANGVYGNSSGDQLVGLCLRSEIFPSWTPNIVQSFVHAGHVSLGHLLFEAALLRDEKELPRCAGRPFNISDPCAPTMFKDLYRLVEKTAETPAKVVYVQPVLILLVAHLVELFDTVSRTPGLGWLKPRGQLALLQPPIFTASTHMPASDAAARKSVDEGGLGYTGVCTTLEGMCQQVRDWNVEHEGELHNGEAEGAAVIVKDVKNVATMPAAITA